MLKDQDLCDRGRAFFSRLKDDKARQWALMVIDSLRNRFPKMDVWITGGLDQYLDVRMGRRRLAVGRGAPVFYLWIDSQTQWPALWAHADIRENLSTHPLLATDAPTSEDVIAWLTKHEKAISVRERDLIGQGLNPADYQSDKNPDELTDVSVAEVAEARSPRLNQILCGPPGTGKTFNTINHALAILEPGIFATDTNREHLKATFDRYVASGQIVFTTFHQSFSYEDFVEGLRASTNAGQVEYLVEPGVFKKLCERASQGVLVGDDPFEKALQVLMEILEQTDGRIEMQTAKGKLFSVAYTGGATFLVYPASNQDLKAGYTGSMDYVRKLYLGADTSGMYNSSYVKGMLTFLKEHCGLPEAPPAPQALERRKPFVLIIDEINRGNVSRIFGELITLIEPSKRTGMPEALDVVLPYSKEKFAVPANLYIIGTMNTADRSLAGLDIALRRRFDFVEMPPKPELLDKVHVQGINLGQLLRVMNERIEILLDRDHCLGHAYFMPLIEHPSLEGLARIFRANVLPLLQEYFFEDWQRIAWVLNDHRKANVHRFLRQPNSKGEELFGKDVPISENGKRWSINDAAFDLPEAYAGVISVASVDVAS